MYLTLRAEDLKTDKSMVIRILKNNWLAYELYIDIKEHEISKGNTQQIERKNLAIQRRLKDWRAE